MKCSVNLMYINYYDIENVSHSSTISFSDLVDLYEIREGMKEIEKNTCIRFVPRKDHHDYIYITPHEG